MISRLLGLKMSCILLSKYRRLLFIIFYLSLSQYKIINETNRHVRTIEQEANDKLSKLLDKQVELNQAEVDNYYDNANMLWEEYNRVNKENEELKEKIRKLERELRH